jgi:hypothetical protein
VVGRSYRPALAVLHQLQPNLGLFTKRNAVVSKCSTAPAPLASIISLALRCRSDAESLPTPKCGRFLLALAAAFVGPRHPSRIERRTSCHPPEYNHSDQIDVTWIFSLSAFWCRRIDHLARRGLLTIARSGVHALSIGLWLISMPWVSWVAPWHVLPMLADLRSISALAFSTVR